MNLPAALSIAKGAPTIAATATPGQFTATYQITVTNAGGVASAYTLNDTPGYPAGIVPSAWAVNSTTGTVNGALPATPTNGAANQISATSTPIGAVTTHTYTVAMAFMANPNVAALACTGSTGNGAFNTASLAGTSLESSNCGPLPGIPNLAIAEPASPWVYGRADAKYTLTVTNAGNASTSGTMTVVDTLPAGVTSKTGVYGNWSCTISGQTVTCTSSTALAALGSSSFDLPVTIANSTAPSITNQASVGGGGDIYNGGVPPAPGSCLAGDNHCGNATTSLSKKSDLTITKTASPSGTYIAGKRAELRDRRDQQRPKRCDRRCSGEHGAGYGDRVRLDLHRYRECGLRHHRGQHQPGATEHSGVGQGHRSRC